MVVAAGVRPATSTTRWRASPSGEAVIRPTLVLTCAATLLTVSAAVADTAVVKVYNWSDYIDPEIISAFEDDTGIRVVYDVFDSNYTLETELLAGNSGYDVVVPSGAFLARQRLAGVFQALDKRLLPNLRHMSAEFMTQIRRWDPGNRHGVPYLWGTTGLGYNARQIAQRDAAAPTNSWQMLFDPTVVSKFADCGVYVLDEPDEVIPAVLSFIGENPDSQDPDVIGKAEPVLMAIRPYIRGFHNSEQIQALADGDICLAMGWSGDMLQARARSLEAGNDAEIRYAIPEEGALMWIDMMAIPADAPNPEHAHRFINYVMRPDVIAAISNHVFYANANAAAWPHLDTGLIAEPGVHPSDEVRASLYVANPYPPEVQEFVSHLWAQVRAAH